MITVPIRIGLKKRHALRLDGNDQRYEYGKLIESYKIFKEAEFTLSWRTDRTGVFRGFQVLLLWDTFKHKLNPPPKKIRR